MWNKWIDWLGNQVFLFCGRLEHGGLREALRGLGSGAAASSGGAKKEGLRAALNRNTPTVAVATSVIILGCFTFLYIWRSPSRVRPAPPVYYMDLNTGELFSASATQLPRVPAPSGQPAKDGAPAGVRAYVYSYGACGDPSQREIGYLEMFTAAALKAMASSAAHPNDSEIFAVATSTEVQHGHLVAKPGTDAEWFPFDSPEGRDIIKQDRDRSRDGKKPRRCMPGDP